MVHPDNGPLFSTKIPLRYKKAWRNLKCILLSKRSQSERANYCVIPTVWNSRKNKITKTVKRSVIARGWGTGEGWMNRQSTEDFSVSESTLYDTIMMDMGYHTFAQTVA